VPVIWPTPTGYAQLRGWRWLARLKDDGYSALKQIRRGCYGACLPCPSVPPSVYARYVQTHARVGTGRRPDRSLTVIDPGRVCRGRLMYSRAYLKQRFNPALEEACEAV
jgi:hypothetical protein